MHENSIKTIILLSTFIFCFIINTFISYIYQITLLATKPYELPWITTLVYSIIPYSWIIYLFALSGMFFVFFFKRHSYLILSLYVCLLINTIIFWLALAGLGLYVFHLFILHQIPFQNKFTCLFNEISVFIYAQIL